MTDVVLILTTYPCDQAPQFVRTLVEERFVACGNIVDSVRSFFRWDGAVQEATEVVILFETARDRLSHALQRIEALHPYDCPKLLTLNPEQVAAGFSQWVCDQTR